MWIRKLGRMVRKPSSLRDTKRKGKSFMIQDCQRNCWTVPKEWLCMLPGWRVPKEETIPLEDPVQEDDFSILPCNCTLVSLFCFCFCFGYLTILQEIAWGFGEFISWYIVWTWLELKVSIQYRCFKSISFCNWMSLFLLAYFV